MIVAEDTEREWQCTECGFVIESGRRPGSCPDCNCVDGDTANPPATRLFVPRGACGWFEYEFVPVLLWLAISVAVAMVAFKAAELVLVELGYDYLTTVKIVGGGSVSYVAWTMAEYYAGWVELTALLTTFVGFYVWNWRANNA